jgi:hypothetical protein
MIIFFQAPQNFLGSNKKPLVIGSMAICDEMINIF